MIKPMRPPPKKSIDPQLFQDLKRNDIWEVRHPVFFNKKKTMQTNSACLARQAAWWCLCSRPPCLNWPHCFGTCRFPEKLGNRREVCFTSMKRKSLLHPDIAHHEKAIPRAPTMKGFPTYNLLVKVARGVFQRCVETTLESIVRLKKFGAHGILWKLLIGLICLSDNLCAPWNQKQGIKINWSNPADILYWLLGIWLSHWYNLEISKNQRQKVVINTRYYDICWKWGSDSYQSQLNPCLFHRSISPNS